MGFLAAEANELCVPVPTLRTVHNMAKALCQPGNTRGEHHEARTAGGGGGGGGSTPAAPVIVTTVAEMQRIRRSTGLTIGCVPTMGSLHPGHLELVERVGACCSLLPHTALLFATRALAETQSFSNARSRA